MTNWITVAAVVVIVCMAALALWPVLFGCASCAAP